MISKKVCMIGDFSVGKTSLVERYVRSIFSEKYLSTVGVKISKKNVIHGNEEVNLVLWDMEGKDIYANINLSYLRGAMGFFAVADGLRKETLETAMSLRKNALSIVSGVPSCLLVNKADLKVKDQWEVTESVLAPLAEQGVHIIHTSAKTGEGIEEAFSYLTERMMRQ